MFLPLFDNRTIPIIFKIGLAFSVSLLLIPMIGVYPVPKMSLGLGFLLGIISEIFLGLSIGLSIKLIFSGIQLGGQLIGYQMGLAIATVLNLSGDSHDSIVSQFYYLVTMMVFLAINAHHWLFMGMCNSFDIIPLFSFTLSKPLIEMIITLGSHMFIIAIKISAPIIVTMLFTSVALGLVARTVPQMNVFFVAMPIKIIISFALMGLMLPMLVSFLIPKLEKISNIMDSILRLGVG